MKKTYALEDLDCAACAAEMEEAAAKVPGVQAIRVDYVKQALTLTADESVFDCVFRRVVEACAKTEPECKILEASEQPCACETVKRTYPLKDLDCAACAAEMEEAVSKVEGVKTIHIDYAKQTLTLTANSADFHKTLNKVVEVCARTEPECKIILEEGSKNETHATEETAKENDKLPIIKMIVGAVFFIAGFFVPEGAAQWALLLLAYLILGYDVLLRAGKNILHGKVFDENFLMTIASLGALAMGDAKEGVAVMLFYQVGEWFQDRAVRQSRGSIAHLMDIRPDHTNLVTETGTKVVSPEEVHTGEILLVKPGERIPLDGVVLEGTSTLNTAALTGESAPRDVREGDTVLSGCVNQSGLLRLRVTGTYAESTVARILQLVEDSSENKAQSERFITRFARWYTPAVCAAALLLAVIPPLFVGNWLEWIRRALTFLVISCPCALVISVPLTFFGGIGGASRRGILVKGANYLELLAKTQIVVFDKTGTLTQGTFTVTAVHPSANTEEHLLEVAALAESFSDHPISASLQAAWHRATDKNRVTDVREISGRGIQAKVDGKQVYAGNDKLMSDVSIPCNPCHHVGTIIHVAEDGTYLGHIVISDQVKPGSSDAIRELKALGVERTVMLTGDRREVAETVSKELSLDEMHAELLPADKVAQVESLLSGREENKALAFVGDGINDAPVLRRADLGIAMGGLGSDAAIEAADIVLMDDDPRKLSSAIRIARKTVSIANQNIVFALGIKGFILLLGALGIANMWLAVFADVGVSMLAILNALRAMRVQ